LSDNPDEVDERVPKFDPDPYPRYVTRALTEVLELIGVMHDGLPQITAPLLLIHGQRYSARVTRGPMPSALYKIKNYLQQERNCYADRPEIVE
jgi:pimeloyl-ACP methyl ester carboxylesterase